MLGISDEAPLVAKMASFTKKATTAHNEKMYLFTSTILGIAQRQFRPDEQTNLRDLLLFTAEKHAEVYRKGDGSPYILHLLRTCLKLLKAGVVKFELLKASILHDVYEDTDAKLREIAEKFGKTTAQIVFLASKVKADGEVWTLFQPFVGNWLNEPFFVRMRLCPIEDVLEWVIVLKFADRTDNLETMKGMPLEKIRKKIQETEEEFPVLLEVLKAIARKQPTGSKFHLILRNTEENFFKALAFAKEILQEEERAQGKH